MKLTVILSPEAGGGYSVICPALLRERAEEGLPLTIETHEVEATSS